MEKNNVIYVPPRQFRKHNTELAFDLREALNANDADKVDAALLQFGIADEKVRKTFAADLLDLWRKGNIPRVIQDDTWPELSQRDTEIIATLDKELDEKLTPKETALLSAMVRCARARPHPTNRIRYEDDRLMQEAGLKDMKTYRETFASLGKKGLIKIAVVGSKNPVTTFELPGTLKETWLVNPDKPMLDAEGNPIEIPTDDQKEDI